MALRQILVNQVRLLNEHISERYHPTELDLAINVSARLIERIHTETQFDSDTEKSEIDWQKGDTVEIKQGWDRAGDHLKVLAPAIFLGQWWVPVDDPEDYEKGPTYHKAAGLERIPK